MTDTAKRKLNKFLPIAIIASVFFGLLCLGQTYYQIQLRRGNAANWTGVNPILHQGEPGFETDTGKLKIGDGSSNWNNLAYFTANAAFNSGNISSVNNFIQITGGNSTTINSNVSINTPFYPLNPANNLNELTNVPLARNNLGLGTAALNNSSDFCAAGNCGAGNGGNMTWPTGSGAVNFNGTNWGSIFNGANPFPANYIPSLSYQAANGTLNTYAATPPAVDAQTLLGHSFAQMQGDLGITPGVTASTAEYYNSANGITNSASVALNVNAGDRYFVQALFHAVGGNGAVTGGSLTNSGTATVYFGGVNGLAQEMDLSVSGSPQAAGLPMTGIMTVSSAGNVTLTVAPGYAGSSGTFWTTVYARYLNSVMAVANVASYQGGGSSNAGNLGTATNIAWSTASMQYGFLNSPNANCAVNFLNAVPGQKYTLYLCQPAAGNGNAAFTNSIRWNGGSAPTIGSGANNCTAILLHYLDSAMGYFGVGVGNF